MTNQEKVEAKIKELQEAVTEVDGSVMIICAIDINKKEKCAITGVTGYASTLSETIASQIASKDDSHVSKIIKKGFVLAHLYRLPQSRKSDVTEKEALESNNQ